MRSFYPAGAPVMVRVAAVVQTLEGLGLAAAAVAQVMEVASGQAYQASSATGLAVLELIIAALMVWIGTAIARLRPWGRTPGVMTQLCVGLLGYVLVQSQRDEWGIPALLLAVAGLVALFTPASLRALRRPDPEPAARPAPGTAPATPRAAMPKEAKAGAGRKPKGPRG